MSVAHEMVMTVVVFQDVGKSCHASCVIRYVATHVHGQICSNLEAALQ